MSVQSDNNHECIEVEAHGSGQRLTLVRCRGMCLRDMLLWESRCCQMSVIEDALEGLVRLIQLLDNCLLFAAYPCGQQWQPRED